MVRASVRVEGPQVLRVWARVWEVCIQTCILFWGALESGTSLPRESVGDFHSKRRWSFVFHPETLHQTGKTPSFSPSARWQTALFRLHLCNICLRLSRSALCYLKEKWQYGMAENEQYTEFYMKDDHRSYRRNFCSCEKKAWPLRYRCSALPIKLTRQLGAGRWIGSM